MLFYKVVGMISDEKWADESNDRWIMQQRIRQIARKGDEFNQLRNDKAYYFISYTENDEVTAGIINSSTEDNAKQIRAFFRYVGISVNNIYINEITFSNIRNLLGCADRNDYIEDDDEVMERMGLDSISTGYMHGIDYGENLLNETTSKRDCFPWPTNFCPLTRLRQSLNAFIPANQVQKHLDIPFTI